MKSKQQKRREAYDRAVGYNYDDSKAKRRGDPHEKWIEQHTAHVKYLSNLLDKRG